MASTLFKRSDHADLYSKFRPSPPNEFVPFMIKYLSSKMEGPFKHAVDVGCGTGQSTVILAPYFEKVTGVDVSEAQIESAARDRSLPNIEFKVADANSMLPFPDESVELVTSCEAIHWFDLDNMYSEVRRILIPGGAFAAYGYWIPLPQGGNKEMTEKMEKVISEDVFKKECMQFWNDVSDKLRLVKNHYVDLPFPFTNVKRMNTVKKSESSLADYINYLSTWSGYQKLYEQDPQKAKDILKYVENQLLDILDLNKTPEEVILTLHSDYFLLIGGVN